MKISIGSDHAGFVLKGVLVGALRARGDQVQDVGTHSTESVDYPDFAAPVARAVVGGEAELGVVVCGTGIGVSIAANKIRGVRAAVCTSEFEGRVARQHNDANILCLGERVTGQGLALAILDAFLSARFEGGRHQRRIDKIRALEGGK